MRIKTKQFTLSRHDFTMIMLWQYFLQQGWGYSLAAILLVIITAVSSRDPVSTLIVFGAGVAVVLVVPFTRIRAHAANRETQAFFQPMRCEIDRNNLDFYTSDGRLDRVPMRSLSRVVRNDAYFLIYVGDHFYYIPISAFHSDADIERTESILRYPNIE